MSNAEETATCNMNNEDENSADEGHSTDPVQKGKETIYEEVHAYPPEAVIHWKLPNRKKASSERDPRIISCWMAFSTTREMEVLCNRYVMIIDEYI